jgi:proton-dependent oligopeptide transporter, POT family
MSSVLAGAAPRREWLGHPRGLSVLFFTEMWERFSYYGMRSLLLLFMLSPASAGGLGFSTPRGAAIYGTYTMAVYALSIPGGWIADRFLGHYRAVLAGGVLITLGHFSMALHGVGTFFLGLTLIVLGTGLLKPNVSTMVGSLYAPEDARRDSGFSLFYMGINAGAMIAPLVCGYLGQKVDWHVGFASAGVGMLAGLVQYVLGRKALAPTVPRESAAVRTGAAGPLTGSDWKRIAVILVLFFFSILFWGAFEQAGSTLTLFADRYTRLSIFGWNFPSSWFQAEQPLFVITLAPVFAWLWVRLGKRGPSSPAKFALGLFLVGLGFLILVPAAAAAQSRGVRVSPMWLTVVYLVHTFGELCLSPVGLSLVTRVAPGRVVGLMMGVWFLGTAFGNRLAGWVAGFFDAIPVSRLFSLVALAAIGGSLLLALLIRPIRRLTGVERSPDGPRRETLEARSA